MMSVAAEQRALRSAASPGAKRPAPLFARAEHVPKSATSLREGPATPFPDLSDPVVRALPISALAVAWAVIELSGRAAKGM